MERVETAAFSVYVLIDPRDGSIRYVGQTRNLRQREAAHALPEKAGSDALRAAWVTKLRSLGLFPRLKVISEHASEDAARDAEQAAIRSYHRAGANLFNRRLAPPRVPMAIFQIDEATMKLIGILMERIGVPGTEILRRALYSAIGKVAPELDCVADFMENRPSLGAVVRFCVDPSTASIFEWLRRRSINPPTAIIRHAVTRFAVQSDIGDLECEHT